jgi:hypothetical protein
MEVALRVQPYGDIKSLYTGLLHSGAVIIIYHDLRAATLAVHHLHRSSFKGQQLSVTFSDSENGRSDSSTEGENPRAPAAAGNVALMMRISSSFCRVGWTKESKLCRLCCQHHAHISGRIHWLLTHGSHVGQVLSAS